MPVETATYISDLVPANPVTADAVNQGDDHIRLLKSVLQATFPHATAAVSAAFADLDHGYVPIGAIILWSGAIGAIPANWHLCDGTAGTYDLRDRFIVGSGNSYAQGSTGGSATTSSDGSHSHTGATGGHTLIASEIPGGNGTGGAGSVIAYTSAVPNATVAHTHPISADGAHTHTVTPPYFALAYIQRIS